MPQLIDKSPRHAMTFYEHQERMDLDHRQGADQSAFYEPDCGGERGGRPWGLKTSDANAVRDLALRHGRAPATAKPWILGLGSESHKGRPHHGPR
jgi:hypothetical protein